MGMYDGLCLERLKKENINKLADEKDVNTFLGTTLPLKVKVGDNSDLDGPSVDGNEKSPKRLNMFEQIKHLLLVVKYSILIIKWLRLFNK